jgi:glycosyltransferase involved in cell wall biosynthesis
MVKRGHTVFVYGFPREECPGTFDDRIEVIPVISVKTWERVPNFNCGSWLTSSEATDEDVKLKDSVRDTYIAGCKKPWLRLAQAGDYAMHFWTLFIHNLLPQVDGVFHVQALDMGYQIGSRPPYQIWCSNAWRETIQQTIKPEERPTTKPYGWERCEVLASTVIAPWVDRDDFEYRSTPPGEIRTGPVVYMARLQDCKGFGVVKQIADAFPKQVFVVAGLPAPIVPLPSNVTYIAHVDKNQRRVLLRDASVLLQPTIYNEPFGLNVIEAWLSGTPVVTSNRGAYVENVTSDTGVTVDIGQSKTLEWIDAIRRVKGFDSAKCRQRAIELCDEDAAYDKYIKFLTEIAV